MINRFSEEANNILQLSRHEAGRLHASCVTPEHLMLAILINNRADMEELCSLHGCTVSEITKGLETVYNMSGSSDTHSGDLPFNPAANDVIRQAILEARSQQSEDVTMEHLLKALVNGKTISGAKVILNNHDIDYRAVCEYFTKTEEEDLADELFDSLFGTDDFDDEDDLFGSDSMHSASTTAKTENGESKTPMLDHFGIDLTREAQAGKLDPVIGREREINRVLEILGRRKKNNPILIGEPGVGKTAIVEGLAQRIAKRETSPVFFNKRIINLDLAGMVAGTKYRGQFEERLKRLMKELEENADVIVFIDEIHTLIGAGGVQGGMDAANMLKPALSRGAFQCIGSTTLDEYRNSIEKDGALERRFQKVMVEPTSPAETLQILQQLKPHYEKFHHVTYTDEALEMCVKLTQRYVTERSFPDKAIDVLDEAGSRMRLGKFKIPDEILAKEKELKLAVEGEKQAVRCQNYELAAGYRDRQAVISKALSDFSASINNDSGTVVGTVTADDVANVVAQSTGIPVQQMAEAENVRLKNMASILKQTVIAQDSAVEKTVKAIQRNRVGLRAAGHPIGAFMFLGPTGVGKTYLAKQLARHMFGSEDALIRIDMSEYSESFNTSRLIGAPPGYVGYEEGGQLTERVRRRPYSIVLLDEIEKAHANVFNMLLQVLDEGRLTDGNGRLVDFRNTIIIMTSNAGTRQLKEFGRGVGFTARGNMGLSLDEKDKEYARSIIQKALGKQFSPEFLNRLDDIITFDQLDLPAIKQIIDIELKDLYHRIGELGYQLQISDAAKEMVASKGYDVQFGARPLKRAIQTYLEDGICERILSGDIKPGDTIKVGKAKGKEELAFS